MSDIDSLFVIVDAYCAKTGLAEATVSTRVFNDGKRLAELREGGEVGVLRLQRALAWLSDNWPDGAEWPEGVARPTLTAPAGAG